ncbi:MAG: GGDEF domain-containing protein [Pseudomonadota bacterium]
MICLLSLDTTKYIIKAYNLKQENITDPLMGIFNRRYLDRRLNEEVLRCQRYSMPFSVLLIDIDFFKKINDSYGHQIGDLVLIRLAQLIVNSVRESDIVARYGGEEILILLPFTNDSKAFALAERLRKSIEKYEIELSDEKSQKQLSINITVSIGVAVFSKKTFDSHGLIEAADKALYRAKHSGRNMVVLSNDV